MQECLKKPTLESKTPIFLPIRAYSSIRFPHTLTLPQIFFPQNHFTCKLSRSNFKPSSFLHSNSAYYITRKKTQEKEPAKPEVQFQQKTVPESIQKGNWHLFELRNLHLIMFLLSAHAQKKDQGLEIFINKYLKIHQSENNMPTMNKDKHQIKVVKLELRDELQQSCNLIPQRSFHQNRGSTTSRGQFAKGSDIVEHDESIQKKINPTNDAFFGLICNFNKFSQEIRISGDQRYYFSKKSELYVSWDCLEAKVDTQFIELNLFLNQDRAFISLISDCSQLELNLCWLSCTNTKKWDNFGFNNRKFKKIYDLKTYCCHPPSPNIDIYAYNFIDAGKLSQVVRISSK